MFICRETTTFSLTDDETTSELVLILPVVQKSAQGQSEGERGQLLLEDGLDDQPSVDGTPHQDVALRQVELIAQRSRGFAHFKIRFGFNSDLKKN